MGRDTPQKSALQDQRDATSMSPHTDTGQGVETFLQLLDVVLPLLSTTLRISSHALPEICAFTSIEPSSSSCEIDCEVECASELFWTATTRH